MGKFPKKFIAPITKAISKATLKISSLAIPGVNFVTIAALAYDAYCAYEKTATKLTSPWGMLAYCVNFLDEIAFGALGIAKDIFYGSPEMSIGDVVANYIQARVSGSIEDIQDDEFDPFDGVPPEVLSTLSDGEQNLISALSAVDFEEDLKELPELNGVPESKKQAIVQKYQELQNSVRAKKMTKVKAMEEFSKFYKQTIIPNYKPTKSAGELPVSKTADTLYTDWNGNSKKLGADKVSVKKIENVNIETKEVIENNERIDNAINLKALEVSSITLRSTNSLVVNNAAYITDAGGSNIR